MNKALQARRSPKIVHKAKKRAEDALADAKNALRESSESLVGSLETAVQERPFAALMVAAGIGAVLALALRR